MLQGKVSDTSHEPDTDKIDLQDFKFVPGDIVTIYERKREEVEQYKVQTVLDEMISLQCVSNERLNMLRWQACATDKLLLGDVYEALSRTKLRKQLLEERQAAQAARAQAAAAARAEADEDMEDQRRGRQDG
jgi:hypothetical protein